MLMRSSDEFHNLLADQPANEMGRLSTAHQGNPWRANAEDFCVGHSHPTRPGAGERSIPVWQSAFRAVAVGRG